MSTLDLQLLKLLTMQYAFDLFDLFFCCFVTTLELMLACFELEMLISPGRIPSSTIAINRHAQFRPHRDSGAGSGQCISLIVGLGDYAGGEIVVETEAHDIRYSVFSLFMSKAISYHSRAYSSLKRIQNKSFLNCFLFSILFLLIIDARSMVAIHR